MEGENKDCTTCALCCGNITGFLAFCVYCLTAILVFANVFGPVTPAGAIISLIPAFGLVLFIFVPVCRDAILLIAYGCCTCLGCFPLIGGAIMIGIAATYSGGNDTNDAEYNLPGLYACGILFLLSGLAHIIGCGVACGAAACDTNGVRERDNDDMI
ncbi:PREDICTED: uncharacterized protein LOC109581752 [Amphimedon queenslandica]|uniref:Transmembrane protein n=2 Tax=Amphimedon queenslandica TaxID=400682 RepID=A0AAN0J4P4_AMPQE|nr:PREDICTED: uncharacterized protein LOC109581752 [Amphimedon queenslandica]|eukprot:XP_019851688.1 PREDICTED: uncharacterized protein LOC109581752 [Amphimedon queenslandica]